MLLFASLSFLAALAAAAPTSTAASPTSTSVPTSTASVTSSNGLKWYNSNLASGNSGRSDPTSGYVCFKGPASNFPAMSTWMNFNSMWNFQVSNALKPIGDNSSEIQAIYDGILSVSKISKVDPRVILSVIILESTGNVRVKCTNNGVQNCGLMQSYNPSDTSYDPNHYNASIRLMIQDGTQGTAAGPGLVQLFNNAQLTNGNVYAALRAYNSGKVNNTNLSDGQGATPSYVSNMANYLQGWAGYGQNGPAQCNFTV